MALLVRRVPANELVASVGEPNQPPDRLLILPISQPHSLTRFEPGARRDQAKVTRPNAGRDHRVTRHPQVERVRVRQVNGCWCPVGVMRLRQVALRRAGYEVADRQPHPRREASQRDRRDLRVGRVGKLLVSLFGDLVVGFFSKPLVRSDRLWTKADVEIHAEGFTDLGHALEGRGAATQDSADCVSVEVGRAGGPDRRHPSRTKCLLNQRAKFCLRHRHKIEDRPPPEWPSSRRSERPYCPENRSRWGVAGLLTRKSRIRYSVVTEVLLLTRGQDHLALGCRRQDPTGVLA